MKNLLFAICLLTFFLLSVEAIAHDKVVVVPLNSSKKLQNVVTVSAKGGDFTDPIEAVNSIADASADNPYLVVIGPGVYTLSEQFVLKPFVTVAGSGRDVTILTRNSGCMVSGYDNTMLSDLTIENKGNGEDTITGICVPADPSAYESPIYKNLNVKVSGGVTNYGVKTFQSALILDDLTITSSGGTSNYGVYHSKGDITLKIVTVNASGGTDSNVGVQIGDGSADMTNMTINASGGTSNHALTVSVFGVVVSDTIIRQSRINGTILTASGGAFIRVIRSSVTGGISGTGITTCINSDNGVDKDLDGSCAVIP